MALKNPKLCAWSGGINLIIKSIIDPNIESLCETLAYTIIYLINEPTYRNTITAYLDLSKILCIFTDMELPLMRKNISQE